MLRSFWRSLALPAVVVSAGATSAIAQTLPVSNPPVILTEPAMSPSPSRQNTSVAFGNDTFAAVWQVLNNTGNTDIHGAVVSGRAPTPTGARPMLPRVTANEIAPSLAFTGTHFLAGWRQLPLAGGGVGGSVVFSSFNVDGSTRTAMFGVSPLAGGEGGPVIACDGAEHCLAVWQLDSGTDVELQAVMIGTGTGISSRDVVLPALPASIQVTPAVAWNGAGYQLVWSDNRAGAGVRQIFGQTVSATGVPGASIGRVDTGISAAEHVQFNPTVACDAVTHVCLVAWQLGGTGGAIQLARLSSDGAGISPPFTVIRASGARAPQLTFDGTRGFGFLLVWEEPSGGPPHTRAVQINPGPSMGTPFEVSMSAGAQPSIASDVANHISFAAYSAPDAGVEARYIGVLPGSPCGSDAQCGGATCSSTGVCCVAGCAGSRCGGPLCERGTGRCLPPPACVDGGTVSNDTGVADVTVIVRDSGPDAIVVVSDSGNTQSDAGATMDVAATMDGAMPGSDGNADDVASGRSGPSFRGGACACEIANGRTSSPTRSAGGVTVAMLFALSVMRRARRRGRPRPAIVER